MFTPQKVWSGLSSFTHKSGDPKGGTGSGSGIVSNSVDGSGLKSKGVAFLETGSGNILENGCKSLLVGSCDDATVSDREKLLMKQRSLEAELYEYQYNMGLLLIEKKEWSSKIEELRQDLEEAKEAVKQERSAHLIAISEVEKREESLRKALGVEKECVLDLEKALREMRSENAEIKFTADSKLAEARALVASIEEKTLEVEANLRATDAKFAEVSRKSAEVDRKSLDLDAREAALRSDRLSFISEQEGHESSLSNQREDLREWERKLQEGEERLAKGQRILNQREQRANDHLNVLKQREKDLEEVQKKIDATNMILKNQDEEIKTKLANLALKEKEFDAVRVNLVKKEEELLELEAKLVARETVEIQKLVEEHSSYSSLNVEIQKLVEEHNAILDVKNREFEQEISQKRKSFENELKQRLIQVEKRESEIKHMEEKIAKQEQALEKKTEKLREKENDCEFKLKAVKEREKSIRSEEKNLEDDKKQICADIEKLREFKAEVEKIRNDNEKELLRIHEEMELLKLSEEERSEYLRLQAELKQEIEQYRLQKELLLKEAEDLKQQKESFERVWEELDVKRNEVERELEIVNKEKEYLVKTKQSEEERLRNEKQVTLDYIERELEALKLAKESFAAEMENEKLQLAEKDQIEKNQLVHEFELQKRELETDMQNQLYHKEMELREKRKQHDEERQKELDNINFLKEVASRDMQEIQLQRNKLGKERQEADENKRYLEKQRIEMRKDIDELGELSTKLRDRREQLVKERDRFIAFVEKLKNCHKCGETISEFQRSEFQTLEEIQNVDVLPVPKLADDYAKEGFEGNNHLSSSRPSNEVSPVRGLISPISGGTISWLRKCTTKIFKFSPGQKNESDVDAGLTDREAALLEKANAEESLEQIRTNENEEELSFSIAGDSFDVHRVQSEDSIREVEASQDLSAGAPEVSQPSGFNDQHNPKLRRGRVRPRIKRTRSVKAVVKDAKAILGESMDADESERHNDYAEGLVSTEAGHQDEVNKRKRRNASKRTHDESSQFSVTEHDADASEQQSDGIMPVQQRRRRQKVASPVKVPAESRYNLRRPKREAAAAGKALSNARKEVAKNDNDMEVTGQIILSSEAVLSAPIILTSENGGSVQFVQCQKSMAGEDGHCDTSKGLVSNATLSEEVNGTPVGGEKQATANENRSESYEEDAVEDGNEDGVEEEEENQHPGEISIGKKFWNFLTT